jgi:putative tricarboxylic transport membrane protein
MQTKILGVTLIAFSALIFWGTLELAPSPFDPLGASAFPRVISVMVALLSILLLLLPSEQEAGAAKADSTSGVSADGTESDEDNTRPTPVMALATVACTIVYAIALQMRMVSFSVSTAIFLVVLMSILTRFSPKAIPATLILSVVFGFGLEYLFTSVFVVNLP